MELVILDTSNLLVGRLVPILATEDTIEILGDCAACGEIIDSDTLVVLDWINKVLIHKRNYGTSCIPLYIEQFMVSDRFVSITETMIMFGVSRSSINRCRKRIKDGIK